MQQALAQVGAGIRPCPMALQGTLLPEAIKSYLSYGSNYDAFLRNRYEYNHEAIHAYSGY